MDTAIMFLCSLVSILVVSILLSLFPWKKKKNTKKGYREVPMAAGSWPLIGHLPMFAGKRPVHLELGAMAEEYGHVFATKLGRIKVLVISSAEIARECFTAHDRVLDRPRVMASKLLHYDDSSLTFAPHGPYWRELRRITTTELLTNHHVEMLVHQRAHEAHVSFAALYRRWESSGRPDRGVSVEMKQEFHDLMANVWSMTVAGRRYYGDSPNCDKEEATRYKKLTNKLHELFGIFLLTDTIPSLAWLDRGFIRAMKRTAKELDEILEAWVSDHHTKNNKAKDYLDLLIGIFNGSSKIKGSDARRAIKALCLDFISDGSETGSVILVWAVSLLLNNPHALKKAQEEVDSVVGKARLVQESDVKDLVYLQAVVKETTRLYPPVPIVCYRDVLQDIHITNGDYHVPAGTQVMVNAWKIHRDPSLWTDPERFEPERFVTRDGHGDVDEGDHGFKLFMFGYGRRACPAGRVGLRTVTYLLARFLHSFDLDKPSSQDVDMAAINALVNLKATPLHVLITPRLHPNLYQEPV